MHYLLFILLIATHFSDNVVATAKSRLIVRVEPAEEFASAKHRITAPDRLPFALTNPARSILPPIKARFQERFTGRLGAQDRVVPAAFMVPWSLKAGGSENGDWGVG